MRHARWLWALVALTLMLTMTTAMAQDAGDLGRITERLDQLAQQIDQAEQTAGTANAQLADADARLAEVEGIVNDLAGQLDLQAGRVRDATTQLSQLRDDADRVQAAFDERAVEMYKRSFGGDLDIVLSAGDIQQAIDRRTTLTQLNKSDQATLEQVDAARKAVQTQQELLAQETARLAQLKADQEVVLARVGRIRQSKALAAADARARVQELADQHENLDAEQADIQRVIAQRQAPAESIAPPPTSQTSGSGFLWPVCGRINSPYGYRWGRRHDGLDIDDNRTSAIVAPKSGVVIFAGRQGAYGNFTLIDHGSGIVTAYGHQASIAVSRGQRVAQGQRIGTVGSTGRSTGTHLHFEVRLNGSPQNPSSFLSRNC